MNEKVPPTASNRLKRKLAREGDLVTYKRKRKRKTIDPSTVVSLNTVDSENEGVSEGVNIPQGLEFETESAQAGLGAQPPLPNVCPDFDENILIFWGYSEGEGATSNDDVGHNDKSLLRSFRFHRARSIALGQEKLPIRVHHHQFTWDIKKEPQVVQDFVKLKGLDRIGAISYNYYNSALISAFVERWLPETNSFHFKWGEMTQTLDNVEQLVGLPADGDATVIGGTWGFLAILEVFENNLLQDLNAFKSLKGGGAGNSLSLKKLKEHYVYKLEKVLSDGTAAGAKKKKRLTTRSVARAYMLYVLGSFQFPTKKGTDVSVRYLVLFAKDKVAKKWSWGSTVLAHMYYNLGAASRDDVRQFACCTTLLEHHEHSSLYPNINVNDQQITALNDQLQKLKEDKEKESEANLNLREALKEKTSECDLLKETIEQMKAEIELKRVVDEQCALEFADLPRQLDAKCKEIESLKVVNTILMEQIDMQLPPATPPVPDTTLAKKYEDLLAAHEDVKKKLIAKEDFVSHSK